MANAKRSQAERSADSTQAMLNGAVHLLTQRGSNASMMDIAKEAGYSHGLLMARFGSKAGLIETVTDGVMHQFTEEVIGSSTDQLGMARINAMVNMFFDPKQIHSLTNHAFMVLLGEALRDKSDVRQAFIEFDDLFRKFVERSLAHAREQGEIEAHVDPVSMAPIIVGLLRGVAMQVIVSPGAINLAQTRSQLDLLLNSIKTRKARTTK